MVETRMDVAASPSAAQAMAERVGRGPVRQAPPSDTIRKPASVEAEVARIFAKRAFQMNGVEVEKPPSASSVPPGRVRGQRLDIRA